MVPHRRQMVSIPGEKVKSPHVGQRLKGRQRLRTYQFDLAMSPDLLRHSIQIVDVLFNHLRLAVLHIPELGWMMVFLNLQLQQDKPSFI